MLDNPASGVLASLGGPFEHHRGYSGDTRGKIFRSIVSSSTCFTQPVSRFPIPLIAPSVIELLSGHAFPQLSPTGLTRRHDYTRVFTLF